MHSSRTPGRAAAIAAATAATLVTTLAAPSATATSAGPGSADQLVAEATAAGSHCVSVVRDGRTVLDRDLAPDVATSQAWSITKSVSSLLVGIARDRGLLDLDDRVSTYVPAWRGTRSRGVTVRHLLANTSGREWSVEQDYVEMAGRAPDKTRYSVRLGQEARPGRVWRYNNAAIQVLEQVLERATGTSVERFARARLFRPLGMRASSIRTDGAGNPMLFGGLMSTCRDLARLGVMLAQDGRYRGRQVVSERYLRLATQRSSSRLNAAYGLLFWVNRPGPVLQALPGVDDQPVAQGPIVPAASRDSFWAIGLGQQLLYVDPTRDVVAVRLGEPPTVEAPLGLSRFTELALGVADAQ